MFKWHAKGGPYRYHFMPHLILIDDAVGNKHRPVLMGVDCVLLTIHRQRGHTSWTGQGSIAVRKSRDILSAIGEIRRNYESILGHDAIPSMLYQFCKIASITPIVPSHPCFLFLDIRASFSGEEASAAPPPPPLPPPPAAAGKKFFLRLSSTHF